MHEFHMAVANVYSDIFNKSKASEDKMTTYNSSSILKWKHPKWRHSTL